MNEDSLKLLMLRAGQTTQSINSDVMTFLTKLGPINHPALSRLQKKIQLRSSLKNEEVLENKASLLTWQTAPDIMLLDSLCSAATDFLKAFQPAMTHADTTCSCSTSWETSIFKTCGPYCTLQVSGTGVAQTALVSYVYVLSDTAQLLDK